MGLLQRAETERDTSFMRRALALAERGLGLTAPNPMVGAVVVSDDAVVGEGWHEGPGTGHAEVIALTQAGDRAWGATLYVTLEPCSHQGRTGPCAPFVIRSGVTRVVAGTQDPNPAVNGRGIRLLEEAGLAVEVGVLHDDALDLIAGFGKHLETGLPFVTMKMASSLDGKVAARDGSSRWITGEEARGDVHRLRAASGAIAVGSGTAMADDPALTVRLEGYRGRAPVRILIDGTGRVEPTGALFDASAPTWVATTTKADPAVVDRWRRTGAEVLVVGEELVSLSSLQREVGAAGIQTMLIEGGPTLGWSAIETGVVDRLVLYLAPSLIGGRDAPGVLGGTGIATLANAIPLRIRSIERLGGDLKVVADVHRHH